MGAPAAPQMALLDVEIETSKPSWWLGFAGRRRWRGRAIFCPRDGGRALMRVDDDYGARRANRENIGSGAITLARSRTSRPSAERVRRAMRRAGARPLFADGK